MKYGKVVWLLGFCLLASCAANEQQQTAVAPPILSTLFWAVSGLITMGIGIFRPQLNRLLGWPPAEERFTVPKFKRSAQLNGRISRAVLICLGLGMILNSVGPYLLPHSLTENIAYALLAFAFLGILLMIIISTGNWRT